MDRINSSIALKRTNSTDVLYGNVLQKPTREEKIKRIMWKPLLCIMSVFEKIMRLESYTFYERSMRILFLVLMTLILALGSFFILFKLLRNQGILNSLPLIISLSLLFAILLFYFFMGWCIKRRHKDISMMLFSVILTIYLIVNDIIIGGIIHSSSSAMWVSMMPILSIFVSNSKFVLVVSIVCVLAMNSVAFYDIFRTSTPPLPEPGTFSYMILLISTHLSNFSFALLGMGTVFLFIYSQKEQLQLSKKVAEAIATLRLESKSIIKLDQANPRMLTDLESLLKQIVDNVRAYKEYLPKTMIAESSSNNSQDINRVELYEAKSTPMGEHEDGKQAPQAFLQEQDRSVITKYLAKEKSTKSSGDDKRFNRGLKTKTLSMLVVDIVDFNKLAAHISSDDLTYIHAKYLYVLTYASRQCHGIIHGFQGDTTIISWGAAKYNPRPYSYCLECALLIKRLVKKLNERFVYKKLPSVTVQMGCMAGSALCGNIGIKNLKGFVSIGENVSRVFKLIKLNSYYSTQIIVDDFIARNVKDKFYLQLVDRVQLHPKESAFCIFELRGTPPSSQWVYELAEKDDIGESNVFLSFNRAYEKYLNGQVELANSLMTNFHQDQEIDPKIEYLNLMHIKRLEYYFKNPVKEGSKHVTIHYIKKPVF